MSASNRTNPTETPPSGPPAQAGPRTNDTAYRVAAGTAVVAAVFSLVVSALLLYDRSRRQGDDPGETATLTALKSALKQEPASEQLKEQIRAVDLELRREYFRQKVFTRAGAILLLGGMIVFVGAAIAAATLHRRVPMPGIYAPPEDLDTRAARATAWSIGGLAGALLAVAFALVLLARPDLPKTDDDLPVAQPLVAQPPSAGTTQTTPEAGHATTTPEGGRATTTPEAGRAATAAYDPPSPEEVANAWPRFRGPDGSGHSRYTNVAETWDGASGRNILWKTPVPLPGNNSPVVWGNRVFLSGASETKREVYCFDAADGKLVWQRELRGTPESTAAPPKVGDDTGFAAPTTVTDGRRVFAMFANGDLAAVDFEGKIAWERSLGAPQNPYGLGSSLAMHKNLVLVQFDQGTRKDKLSKLLALRTADGQTAWQADRDVPSSWTTPLVARAAGRDQLITSADPWVIAYDPSDGKELWRAKCMRQDVGPSPICRGDVVVAANEFPGVAAIRADGSGDVTQTRLLWQGEDNLPDTCSPLATDEFVFLLASYGILTCYDAKTGKMLWDKEFDNATFTSSPSLVGNRLYLIGREKSYVVEPAREGCKPISEAALGEECVTSPAFQDGRFYLRGKENLFCIGSKK
jgi:outer membrane protein assembly factor BamB